MNSKEFAKYLRRDEGGCIHCGNQETAIPQHRINRQMGGSKLLNRPSNIVVICSELNWRMEADADVAEYAKSRGWKLERWQDPEFEPVWYATEGQWFYLDNFYERSVSLDI
jgi:hypothetical protein